MQLYYNLINEINSDDNFLIWKSYKYGKSLDYFTSQINFDNYFIYKSSGKQKEVTKEDFLKFEYSRYIFFNKNKYDNKIINKKLNYIFKNKINFLFISKPLPRLSDLKKIKVINGKL